MKSGINSCVISLDTESRTNHIRKVINKNEQQSKFEDRALRDSHIYISIFLGSMGRSLDRAAKKKKKKKVQVKVLPLNMESLYQA